MTGESSQGEQVPMPVKCRKCRKELFVHPKVTLQDAHGGRISDSQVGDLPQICNSEVYYVPEDCKPDWLEEILEKHGWEKGKINCPHCSARIGSYNFISGMKCPCGAFVLPPIHLVKSKVDFTPRLLHSVLPNELFQQ